MIIIINNRQEDFSTYLGKEKKALRLFAKNMTLYEAEKDKSYLISELYVEPAITRRLQALGLNDGTTVKVLNRKKKGALIIQVRGTRLALGRHISSHIEIK